MGSIASAPAGVRAALAGLLVFATAVWVGGFITLALVTRVAQRTLRPNDRVSFFRALGRGYNVVGIPALLVGLAAGATLLAGRPWTAPLIAGAVVACLLVITTAVGIVQARAMTRLRHRALAGAGDPPSADEVGRAARRAAWLRGCIGGLSLTLVALGALLAG